MDVEEVDRVADGDTSSEEDKDFSPCVDERGSTPRSREKASPPRCRQPPFDFEKTYNARNTAMLERMYLCSLSSAQAFTTTNLWENKFLHQT